MAQVNIFIAALARGYIYIPYVSTLPISLFVNRISPFNLFLHFTYKQNNGMPPEQWSI